MLKIGADPELFCFDKNAQQFISAHTFFPGTKDVPFPVKDGALQLDGLAAEININPVDNADDFVKVLRSVLGDAQNYLPQGVELVARPSVIFDETYYKSIPDLSKQMGCTPDFNAWEFGEENPSPFNPIPSLRAAGGHIHFGWDEGRSFEEPDHARKCCDLVRQLDCIVGLQCMLWDTDDDRRKLYGKAGAMRPKSYGVEYRTPSNDWLSSEEKMRRVFQLSTKAYEDLEKGILYFILHPYNVQDIINFGDRTLAKEALDAVLKVG